MSKEDRKVVSRVIRGDQGAFEELVDRYGRLVYAVAMAHTTDSESAEDVTQSAFLEAFLSLRTLQDRSKFKSWLLGITRNVANGHRRREGRFESVPEMETMIDTSSLPDAQLEQAELRSFVMKAIDSLSEDPREAVIMHYVQGFTYEEIADALEVPQSTILGRLQTARAQLRSDLEGVVEEVLGSERSDEGLKGRVLAILPLTCFSKGSLLGVSFLGGRSVSMVGASAVAAIVGTSLYFGLFSSLLSTEANVDAEATNSIRMEISKDLASTVAEVKSGTSAIAVSETKDASRIRPTIGLQGSPTDEKIVITYEVPKQGMVEVTIRDRSGNVMAVPVLETKPAGTYSLTLSKRGWPSSTYRASIQLDSDPRRRRGKQFQHFPGERALVYNKQLREMQNQAMVSTRMDPERSVELWDELLNNHPDYLDRGSAFLYSIMALVRTEDSSRVHSHADSAVALIPGFETYNQISRFVGGLESDPAWENRLYPNTALKFAKLAIEHSKAVPAPHREGAQIMAMESMRRGLLISGDLDGVVTNSKEALELHAMLPEGHRRIDADVTIHRDLGVAYSRQGHYTNALESFRSVLPRRPFPDLWTETQLVYAKLYPSMDGWDEFEKEIESQIPTKFLARLNQSNVGRAFPDFNLVSLDSAKVGLSDLVGGASVVNLWNYWCGPCVAEMRMLQQLANSYSHTDVKFLGIHAGGVFGIEEDHIRSVRRVADQAGATYPMVLDDGKVIGQTGARSIPTTFVLDQNGKIKLEIRSTRPQDAQPLIKEALDELLRSP